MKITSFRVETFSERYVIYKRINPLLFYFINAKVIISYDFILGMLLNYLLDQKLIEKKLVEVGVGQRLFFTFTKDKLLFNIVRVLSKSKKQAGF
jgi:hypothetical protein